MGEGFQCFILKVNVGFIQATLTFNITVYSIKIFRIIYKVL